MKVKLVSKEVIVDANPVKGAMGAISKAMKDPGYRVVWYANIKFAIHDNSIISQKKAGEITDIILKKFFNA